MKRLLPLLLALSPVEGLAAGCAHSMDDDLGTLRAEIVTLEKQRLEREATIWPHHGPNSFDAVVEDGDQRVPDFIYYHVLRKLKEGSADEFRKAAGEEFDWAKCMDLPAAYRGRFWRVSGVIGRIWVENIDDPESPVKKVYAGIFYVNNRDPILFHLIEKPDMLRLREDVVEIDGLFFKILAYRSPSGRTVSAPFFLAKNMRKFM